MYFRNLLRETTTSNSSPFTLAGAADRRIPLGHSSLGFAEDVPFAAMIEHQTANEMQLSRGHLNGSGQFVVDRVIASRNGATYGGDGSSAITFSAGTKDIYVPPIDRDMIGHGVATSVISGNQNLIYRPPNMGETLTDGVPTADTLYYLYVPVPFTMRVTGIRVLVRTAAGTNAIAGIYLLDGGTRYPGVLLSPNNTRFLTSSAGVVTASFASTVEIPGGIGIAIALAFDGGPTCAGGGSLHHTSTPWGAFMSTSSSERTRTVAALTESLTVTGSEVLPATPAAPASMGLLNSFSNIPFAWLVPE